MARLTKSQLFGVFENAVLESGWSFLHLSDAGVHPARYQVYQDGAGPKVRVYIWNMTHGGGEARPVNEYRIQITGIAPAEGAPQQFLPEIGGKTLILGYWHDVGVFVGFDFTRHSGLLGASPSMQIGEEALNAANRKGFAAHSKGNGELAIAFRPDFMAAYIANLEALHETGVSPREVEILDEIGEEPNDVTDEEINSSVAQERQYAVVSTKRALRDLKFRGRVLTAYSHQCAICCVQLRLLDAAHILPVAHPDSTDQTSNGIALCALHHRAYDRGFLTFDSNYRVHLNVPMVADIKASGHDGGLDKFANALRPLIALPADRRDHPDPAFIKASNYMRGWVLQ